jgi:hypothetical protein
MKKVDFNASIVLVSDQNMLIEGVHILHVENIITNQTKRVIEMNLFKRQIQLFNATVVP